MYALILTICTVTSTILGFNVKECVIVSPASYANYNLCQTAGKAEIAMLTIQTTKATFTCEKTK